MANTGFKGIDVRQTGSQVVFRCLETVSGAALSTGTTTVELYELQSDGTLLSYDFSSNTFKSTALTTATLSLTQRSGNNATTTTGLWTGVLSTLTGLTIGAVYLEVYRNSGADCPVQSRMWQYGGAEGDLAVTANGTGVAYLMSDVKALMNQILSGTAANIAAAFSTFFNVASSVLTCASVNQTGDNYARTGAPVGASISADIAAVKTSVGTPMQASSYVAPTTPPTAVQIRTEMDANSTKLANLDATVSSRLPTSGYTAPSTPPTAAAIATAILTDTTASDFTTAGSPGKILSTLSSKLPANAIADENLLLTAIGTPMQASSYVAPTTPPTAVQIRTEMDANSTKLANLDATVSSRLPTSSYVAPTSITVPTVIQIRQEMDANSTKLANLDATVSSRLPTSGYTAPSTPPTAAAIATAILTDTTASDFTTAGSPGKILSTLSSKLPVNAIADENLLLTAIGTPMQASSYVAPTTPPTAVQIRTEMDANSTKLANLDATVSSRLPTSSYVAPTSITVPTVIQIRQEMDANSTKLANLDATVSSRLPTSGYTAPSTPPTAAAIATAILTDTTASDFTTAGSPGKILSTLSSKLPVNAIADENLLLTAIGTPMQASSYVAPTTPPTAVQIRTEMDANSTKLANLDATVSSRLPTASYVAPTSITVPTVIQIRQEMDANSTKLANLDATVSSRLPTSGYTAPSTPPTAVQIRTEMDTNSTKLAAIGTPAQAAVLASDLAAIAGYIATSQAGIVAAIPPASPAPPSPATIATAVANALLTNGTTNKLQVNADGSVNTSIQSTNVVNYITVPPGVAAASQEPQVITCLRGDTLRVSLPPMGSLTGRTRLVMTAKINVNDGDELAVFQIAEATGLTRLNGAASANSGSAGLTVVDPVTGNIVLEIDASITAQFMVSDYVWDVQVTFSTGIKTPISGTMSIIADVTQSVT